MSKRAALAALASLIFGACGLKPTRTIETQPRFSPPADSVGSEPSPEEPIALTHETAVIDVRPAFEFASSRIPRSVSMQWSDFAQNEPAQRGVLQPDLFRIARRLARAGISPDTPVVVVGNGQRGGGEEGRMAWMLRYLGVKRVRFASIFYFPGPFVSRPPSPMPGEPADAPQEPAPRNAPVWKPQPAARWLATQAEIRDVINKNKLRDAGGGYALIDARPAKDYLGQEGFGFAHPVPNMGAVNAPWTDFVDSKGRVDCGFAKKLQSVGVTRDKRVIAFDEYGVASGGVAVALRTCGWTDAANYAGGLRDLMNVR